ncbi:VOC family protein [Demetria terragena]|uniref:VOC family protein n=1 Tax=Demetria terragena TaxID=63959 RepID=UPI00036BA991|nr:VOC family protein [Demetria terragena]
MRLENISWDCHDERRVADFWVAAFGLQVGYEGLGLVEARLDLGEQQFLDLCFAQVPDPFEGPQRLHLDLLGGADQDEVVQRLLGLGATHVDLGQGEVPWVVLADPEGNAFCVMEHREEYARGTGPIASLPLDSSDPERDGAFWAAITGWQPAVGYAPVSLRHPSGAGPLLELCVEPEPRQGKSRLHLDVRPDRGDPDLVESVRRLGGRVLEQPAPDLPWTVCADPSGNEVCILAPQ